MIQPFRLRAFRNWKWHLLSPPSSFLMELLYLNDQWSIKYLTDHKYLMYLEVNLFLDTVHVYCFCNCTYQKSNTRIMSDGTYIPDTTKVSLKLSLRFLSPKIWSCFTITTWNNQIWAEWPIQFWWKVWYRLARQLEGSVRCCSNPVPTRVFLDMI